MVFTLDRFFARQQLVQRTIPLLEPVQIYPYPTLLLPGSQNSLAITSTDKIALQPLRQCVLAARTAETIGKPVPAPDRPKGVCRPFAHGLFLAPSHQECSPDPVRATASARPTSVPNRRQESLQCARPNSLSFSCRRPAAQ